MREEMMEDMGIPDNIQEAIVDNHEPNADGIRTGPTKTSSSSTDNSNL